MNDTPALGWFGAARQCVPAACLLAATVLLVAGDDWQRTSARNILAFVLPASAILTLILLAGVSLMSETQRAEAAARRKRFRSTPGLAAGHAITACVCGSLVVLAAEGHHLLAGCLLFGFCNHAIANSLVDDAAKEADR